MNNIRNHAEEIILGRFSVIRSLCKICTSCILG